MNERIRELWNQSRYPSGRGHDEEKFALLIVKECAEVVQEGRWMVPPSQHQLARSIKQHFGVEE